MKTRDERMYEHLYSNEGRVEQCERICNLEELVRDLYLQLLNAYDSKEVEEFVSRIAELGIEVEA